MLIRAEEIMREVCADFEAAGSKSPSASSTVAIRTGPTSSRLPDGYPRQTRATHQGRAPLVRVRHGPDA